MLGLDKLEFDEKLDIHTVETEWFHEHGPEKEFYKWFKKRTKQPSIFNPFRMPDEEIRHSVDMNYLANEIVDGGTEHIQWNLTGDDPMLDRLKGSPRIELICEHNEETRKYCLKLATDKFASNLLLHALLSDFNEWRNRRAVKRCLKACAMNKQKAN